MPENAQINMASEINFKPMVSHQMIKNGFNPLSIIPVTKGPWFEFDVTLSFFCSAVLICNIAKAKSVIAPKIEMTILNSGKISKENTPTPNKTTNGNSTIVWPTAILMPDLVPPRNPYDTLAAKSGPGAMTPDAEIAITIIANSRI